MNKVLVTTTAVIALFIFVQPSFAAQISVEPEYQDVPTGEFFTVNITVDPEGNETYGAQYWLYFNNTPLNATSQIKGPFLGNGTHEWANETNNTLGIIKYSESRQKPVITGVTTPGILATITFKAMEPGMSSLNLSKVKLTDPDTQPIPNVLINNGTCEIKAEEQTSTPTPTSGGDDNSDGGASETPTPTTSPTATPAETVGTSPDSTITPAASPTQISTVAPSPSPSPVGTTSPTPVSIPPPDEEERKLQGFTVISTMIILLTTYLLLKVKKGGDRNE